MCRRARSPAAVARTRPRPLGPVPRIVVGVDEHRDPGVPADVPGPLALRLGVHQDVLTIGVHPGQQGLRLAIRHQGHHRGQVLSFAGQPDDVRIKWHEDLPSAGRWPFPPVQWPKTGIITARARVWKPIMKPATAGETSESTPRESTLSACTANTYRCGGSPAGGAAPPKSLVP